MREQLEAIRMFLTSSMVALQSVGDDVLRRLIERQLRAARRGVDTLEELDVRTAWRPGFPPTAVEVMEDTINDRASLWWERVPGQSKVYGPLRLDVDGAGQLWEVTHDRRAYWPALGMEFAHCLPPLMASPVTRGHAEVTRLELEWIDDNHGVDLWTYLALGDDEWRAFHKRGELPADWLERRKGQAALPAAKQTSAPAARTSDTKGS